MNTIAPLALRALHERDAGVRLIDVRTPAEFGACHVPFAENMPLKSLDAAAFAGQNIASDTGSLYVICQKGGRGANACAKLDAVGVRAINVDGGTAAWEQAGLPLVRGQRAISLERQVRIAAGSLVVMSVLCAIAIHPYFLGLAAFIGAGLMFAGITDTCGMAMLLAKMPWNQVSSMSAVAAVCERS